VHHVLAGGAEPGVGIGGRCHRHGVHLLARQAHLDGEVLVGEIGDGGGALLDDHLDGVVGADVGGLVQPAQRDGERSERVHVVRGSRVNDRQAHRRSDGDGGDPDGQRSH
jgi:hypothetical protein